MSIEINSTNNILTAVAYNSDGSIKDDLTFNESNISIVVQRVGLTDSSALVMSSKASPGATHSDGAFYNYGGGSIAIDVPDAHFQAATKVRLYGTFDGGYLVGDWEQVVGYDPTTKYAEGDAAGRADIGAIAGAVVASISDFQSGIAAAVETAILNEGDASAVLSALAAKVEEFVADDSDATALLAAFASAVRAELNSNPVPTSTTQMQIDMNQATPGGSDVGAQLDAAGTGGGSGSGSGDATEEKQDSIISLLESVPQEVRDKMTQMPLPQTDVKVLEIV